ncbi:PTS sugar transporter subunit IIA [Streptomyces sp. enrichment culture]|uniref:PTS sugar transporter subunit IIA n=1 Tax=Streptomyces sp. enrichment culture TaxID=1795815 RepID=UPI003F54DE00
MENHIEDRPAATRCGILVTGHGRFAGGLIDATEVIMGGPQADLVAVDFPASDTAAQLRENLTEGLNALKHHEKVVVLCDLRGGSPFNVMHELRGTRTGVELFHGVNLPQLITFVSERDRAESVESLLASAVADGRAGLGRLEEPAPAPAAGDADDDWA